MSALALPNGPITAAAINAARSARVKTILVMSHPLMSGFAARRHRFRRMQEHAATRSTTKTTERKNNKKPTEAARPKKQNAKQAAMKMHLSQSTGIGASCGQH